MQECASLESCDLFIWYIIPTLIDTFNNLDAFVFRPKFDIPSTKTNKKWSSHLKHAKIKCHFYTYNQLILMNCVDFGGHFIQPHKMIMKNNSNHRVVFLLLSGTAVPWTPPLIGARDNNIGCTINIKYVRLKIAPVWP